MLFRSGHDALEQAFVALLPEAKRRGHQAVQIPPLDRSQADDAANVAIEARDLTMRFGDFVAVDHVSFRIQRGEIFGFLGSNGCGKSTTMKMLTGLLPASDGQAWLFGQPVDPKDLATRRRVGSSFVARVTDSAVPLRVRSPPPVDRQPAPSSSARARSGA